MLRQLRHRGRDPRDQIEELEDANDKLSRAGGSNCEDLRILERRLDSFGFFGVLWDSLGYFWYVTIVT